MADADKRVVLGSDKPCPEGVVTSLRFTGPSQPGSFTPPNYGSDASSGLPDGKPDDSPIVTSPVSERIKALEALAAKKEQELRNEGGFPHFKERHYEKSPPEVVPEISSPFQKKGATTDQASPESPFEVLGEARHGSEFEDTAVWMRAHLPPVLDFEDKQYTSKDDVVSENGGKFKEVKVADKVVPDVPEAFACVPDAFMDSLIEGPKLKDLFKDPGQHSCVEEESEFDLRFLPTAYMTETQGPLDHELPASPAPPAGFDTHSSPPPSNSEGKNPKNKPVPWGGDLEPPEVVEADSSGDSDDTVIEDAPCPRPLCPRPLCPRPLCPRPLCPCPLCPRPLFK
ncbi:hypothetical protein DPEC_G00101390 [Dallia pectoralis]|uniref:Uncharacterized protein n=1 Tax=Dallia pectoralis TaxID=75939 RepID=A0ACC2GWE5_DALPE|nr:hypothetical protein DPEC_G00101390 [Dallia pectoralis]